MSSLCEVQNQPEMQCSLLSVLGNKDQNDVSHTLLGMSKSPETCAAMRSSGCLPLIIRLLYAPDSSQDMKKHVAHALYNIVNSNPDEEQSKLEVRVLNLLENVRQYCDNLVQHSNGIGKENQDKSIGMTVATILRLSFDVDQRRALSVLGGIHSIAYLIQVLHEVHRGLEDSMDCVMLKRYASMALTNLTSGHTSNKAVVCSRKLIMHALVSQLTSSSEELQQATASVIRNLSWKADGVCKQILRETGAVSALMKMAMIVRKESTLKSMLSALWNLSSNCSFNKIELCAVHGSLAFLTHTLTYKSPSQTLCVIEYAGGVLRNVSSHLAEREDYRAILREHDCLQVLTQHLTSPSPRVVSNACIILWNLSFDSPNDQYTLWMLGAPNLLRNLIHSKHKLIALGSSATLKNLLSGRPESEKLYYLLVSLPASSSSTGEANHRRSRTVEEELDEVLSESNDGDEPHDAPSTVAGRRDDKFIFSVTDVEKKRQQRRSSRSRSLSRSESKELVSPGVEKNHDGMKINANGDRKHSSNIDLTSSEDFPKPCAESNQVISNRHIGKYACLIMKDDTEGDLHFENEAISTVDELLEVVRDMKSLRLNEVPTSLKSSDSLKNDNCGENEECKATSEESTEAKSETNDDHDSTVSEVKSKGSFVEERTTNGIVDKSDQLEQSLPKENILKNPPEELRDETNLKNGLVESVRSTEELKELLCKSSDIENGFIPKDSQSLDPELEPSLEQTPTDELASTKDCSVPNSVSPRLLESLSTDELTTEDSSLVKKECPEEALSDEMGEVKKELGTPEELERSLEELTFEEEASNHNLLVYPVDERSASNAHYVLDLEPERDESPEVYGDYAETDLDQPTDYSLQYGEDDELTDDEVQGNKRDATFYDAGVAISMHEDTLKTYCTEGTPFETPYNFSTATSMSDLRAEPSIKVEMDEVESETASVGQQDVAGAILVGGPGQVKAELIGDALLLDRIHSMDSGLLSPPEKPVEFCEEGTPGQCISRFSSLSSLCEDEVRIDRPQLDGGRNSSRYVNAGSEHCGNTLGEEFSSTRKNDNDSDKVQPKLQRPGVFEDSMVYFKDETTPVNFSCATSLSSLSFDGEPKIPMDVSLKGATALQRVSTDSTQHSNVSEKNPDSALPACSKFNSRLQSGNEVFFSPNSMQGPCRPKPVSPGFRSPRVPIKQENEQLLLPCARPNGEDADASSDYMYRFCTEGTPANISHAGSHSELSALSAPGNGKLGDKSDEFSDDNRSFSDEGDNIHLPSMPKMAETKRSGTSTSSETFVPKEEANGGCDRADNPKQREDVGDRGKVVTFDNADHYAQETPLMFSRSSSLASLSSFDQHSIVDDRSSIMSDLSRLTSGAVSPSEIPDSSSPLVSASPHRSKAPSVGEPADVERNPPTFSGLPPIASRQAFNKSVEAGVFEDDIKPFEVEDTPVEFSRATSLSSLSFCDDTNPVDEAAACLTKDERQRFKDAPKEGDTDKSDKNSINLESEGEEDDDAILAACISIGMQQSRKPQDSNPPLFKNRTPFSPPTSHSNYSPNHKNHPTNHLNPSGLPPTNCVDKSLVKPIQQLSNAVKIPSRCSEPVPESDAFDDVTHRYFTEDTPANISHATSQSDLSTLSFRSDKDEAEAEDFGRTRTTTELSDDLFNFSDNEGMLAECIQAGMPKKSTTKKRSNPEKEINGTFSPRHQFKDDRNGMETFLDRPRSRVSSQQLSPILHKSKPSRSTSANSHVNALTTKSSHSRKSTTAPTVEPRRVEGAGAFGDSMYRFNTEDTPASVSHAGSNSDISVLSIPDDDKEFYHDFHKNNCRQHSFHDLSDESLDNSDNENILAECIQSGMPKSKSATKPIKKPSHSTAAFSSPSLPHHCLDANVSLARRPLNQVSGSMQQFQHGSRPTSRASRNAGPDFSRRSHSQSDRPQNYPMNVNHGFVLPHQSYGNDTNLNRNVVPTGMWSTATTHRLPSFNREKEFINTRNPNNNSNSCDSGLEIDTSIVKDPQSLRSMIQNHQSVRWLRKFCSTSPSNRRQSESQCSTNTYYSRENSGSTLQINGDLPSAQCSQPTSLPPNIRPLDRQRTFTKLEPSLHSHLPSPSSKTKIPVPAQPPVKLPEKATSNSKKMAEQTIAKGRLKSKALAATSQSQTKQIDNEKGADRMKNWKSSNGYSSSTSKASGSWSAKSTPTSTLRSNGTCSFSSSSTSSLVFKQNTAERRSFRVSRPTGLEDKRSNSFSSITSSASSKSSVRLLKRDVSSKVASLWKRTDNSLDDEQEKTRKDSKSSDSEKRAPATRKMVRSATFEGLPRNFERAKTEKIKDDSQVRLTNHVDRSRKVSHRNQSCIDKKDDQMKKVKSQIQYNKSSENVSRDVPCTSVINRHDRAMTIKSNSKSDQSSVRVTKV